MRLRLLEFGGIAPKIANTQLPADMARAWTPDMEKATINAKTWSRSLKPFRAWQQGSALEKTGTIQTLYWYLGTTWLHWTQDVDVAKNSIAGDTLDKIYFTGTDYPRATANDVYNLGAPGTSLPPASYILGIPAPTDTPTSAAAGVGVLTGDFQWVYTFVRQWSDGTVDEGPPSAVSTSLTLASQQATVQMPNTGAPTFANYGITHKRLYRLTVGETGATYDYVTQVSTATTSYTDNTANADLGDPIETSLYAIPPNDMKGIIALPNGVYVGFSGNTLLCSDPYHAHAWPLGNRYGQPGQITGLGAFGTTVVVCLDEDTRVANVIDPTAVTSERLADSRICTSKRGIVSTPMGVLFPTNDGMALAGPNGYDLVTKTIFDRVNWQVYEPGTIHGHWLEGRYHGFYGGSDGGGFILEIGGRPHFTPVNVTASAAGLKPEDDLLYLVDYTTNRANLWEGRTNANLSHDYTSKTFITPSLTNFGYGKIEADYGAGLSAAQQAAITAANLVTIAANQLLLNDDLGDTLNGHYINQGKASAGDNNDDGAINGDIALSPLLATDLPNAQVGFKLYGDEALLTNQTITSATPFPLPSQSLATRFYMELSGNIEVFSVAVANDADELGAP